MTLTPPPVACVGCQAPVPDLPESYGPEHRYIGASPGCWFIFGEVRAALMNAPYEVKVRGLLTDTYMVQHPGVASRQSIQSVARHLLGLYCALECEMPFDKTTKAMQRAPVDQFIWLTAPQAFGPMTIVDIVQSSNATQRVARIERWAYTTWEAWKDHHQTMRSWAARSFSR